MRYRRQSSSSRFESSFPAFFQFCDVVEHENDNVLLTDLDHMRRQRAQKDLPFRGPDHEFLVVQKSILPQQGIEPVPQGRIDIEADIADGVADNLLPCVFCHGHKSFIYVGDNPRVEVSQKKWR